MLYSFLLFLWWLSYHRLLSFLHLTQTLPYTTCDILWALAAYSVVDKHCVSTKPIINRPESLWWLLFQSIVFVFIQCGHKEWVWVVQIRNYRQQISKYGINRKISRACLVTCAVFKWICGAILWWWCLCLLAFPYLWVFDECLGIVCY